MTPKQQRFVEAYLKTGNAAEAYRTAYRSKGSAKRCADEAYRLLQHPDISRIVEQAEKRKEQSIARAMDRYAITPERILGELARIGLSDIRDMFDDNGNLRRLNELSDDAAAAVASVKVVTRNVGDGEVEYVHEVKRWDKTKALQLLGQHLKLYTDKLEVDVKGDIIERLLRGRERARNRD
jgi:phage terminase small subunit